MSQHKPQLKVAISSDFLDSFAKIPKSKQSKVLSFINQFKKNPASPGINYEKIQQARDPNLRSVRIDQAYRGIVLKPQKGNVFVLLWVDNHDEAYRWAANKTCAIHPATGSLQVLTVEEEFVPAEDVPSSASAVVPGAAVHEPVEPAAAVVKTTAQETEAPSATTPALKVPDQISSAPATKQPTGFEQTGLFDNIRDKHLLRLGVPEMMLPLVRNIITEGDLEYAEEALPEEASEALFLLAAGYPLNEVYLEMEKSQEAKKVDTLDFAVALENIDSKRRFYIIEDDLELAAILNAPLEKWRVFLHPTQRKLVEKNWNGPARVLGGAGTGKTVVALHRAKWLTQNVFTGRNDRILFTTYTRNLAADIQENLSKLCPDDVLKRIEVVNLDRWVYDFLKRHGYSHQIIYGNNRKDLWHRAVNLAPTDIEFTPRFYREEWEHIIQQKEIDTLAEYMRVSRVGRGVRLSRKARKEIWPVFEEYKILLDEHEYREPEDAMRDARLILEQKGDILPYKAIVVDEAQDMSVQAYRLLRQMITGGDQKNDLFIVGDSHQRIYKHKVVLSHCDINIRGRGRRLRINYRTTDENRCWAVGLLKGISFDDLDGGQATQKGYKSLLHGVEPTVKHFDTYQEEIDYIVKYLQELETRGGSPSSTCLVVRTTKRLEEYDSALRDCGIETYFVKRSRAEDRKALGVRLATMHRVKGLEFDNIIIASVNYGLVPYEHGVDESYDDIAKQESETRERALLYVAATRAKKEVLVTSFEKMSRFLKI